MKSNDLANQASQSLGKKGVEIHLFLPLLGMMIFVGIIFACSASVPQIQQNFYQLNIQVSPEDPEPREVLSVFALVENEDGREDLEKLYILHDESQLYWELFPETWDLVQQDGNDWIGSNFLLFPQEKELPRGMYRVQITNKAGKRTESSFFLDTASLDSHLEKLFEVGYQEGTWSLENSPGNFIIWVYNRDGTFLLSKEATGDAIRQSSIANSQVINQAAHLFFYSYWPQEGVGQIHGPHSLQR